MADTEKYKAEDPLTEYNKYRDLRNACLTTYQQTGDSIVLLRAKNYQKIMDEIWEKRILKS